MEKPWGKGEGNTWETPDFCETMGNYPDFYGKFLIFVGNYPDLCGKQSETNYVLLVKIEGPVTGIPSIIMKPAATMG